MKGLLLPNNMNFYANRKKAQKTCTIYYAMYIYFAQVSMFHIFCEILENAQINFHEPTALILFKIKNKQYQNLIKQKQNNN